MEEFLKPLNYLKIYNNNNNNSIIKPKIEFLEEVVTESTKIIDRLKKSFNCLNNNSDNNSNRRQKIEFFEEVLTLTNRKKELMKIIDGLEIQKIEFFEEVIANLKKLVKSIDELKRQKFESFESNNDNSDSDDDEYSFSDIISSSIESSSDDSTIEDPELKEIGKKIEITESKQNEKRKIIEVDNSSESNNNINNNQTNELNKDDDSLYPFLNIPENFVHYKYYDQLFKKIIEIDNSSESNNNSNNYYNTWKKYKHKKQN